MYIAPVIVSAPFLELLSIVPSSVVLNLEYSFIDTPLLFGLTISTCIALFGVFKMVGRLAIFEFLSGRISAKLKVGVKIKEKEITILIGKDGFTPISILNAMLKLEYALLKKRVRVKIYF